MWVGARACVYENGWSTGGRGDQIKIKAVKNSDHLNAEYYK